MKKGFLLFSLAVAGIGLFSFSPVPQTGYTIDGNITGLQDAYIYFRGHAGDSVLVDSAAVTNGKFSFKGQTATPYLATIYLKDMSDGFQFYVENAKIKITGNIDSLSDVKITGSPTQKVFESYKASVKDIEDQMQAKYGDYRTAYQQNDTATMETIGATMDSLNNLVNDRSKSFIEKNSNSVVSLDQLQQLLYGTPYDELEKLYTGLSTTIKDSKSGKKMADILAIMKKTAVGQQAIPFTQNDVNGKAVSLSDFRGKYVLVDFWASWCGPCRAENPNVVKAYNQFKDKNFTILGVSLDSKEDNWKKAIEQDGLTWTQVSDLKFWKNEVAEKYGVRAIPANFLIDPNGKIIGHNLRGEELVNKLNAVLN